MGAEGNPRPVATRRPLNARTAVVTATGQVIARGSTLLLTVAGTVVVTRAIGEEGFAGWGTVLMLTAMFAFMLDPGLAPVVVRRLAQAQGDAPTPRALLNVRLLLSAVAFVLVVSLTVALRSETALVLGLVLGAQLIPRAVVMNAGTWMQAEHRLHVQTWLEAATMAVGLVLLILAALMDAPAAALAGVGVLLPALALAALMQRELRKIANPRERDRARERATVRAVLREAAPLAGAIVLVSLYTRIGVVFVNEGKGNAAVADFTFAFLFIEQAIVVAAIIAATLLPILAERSARHAGGVVEADLLALVTFIGTAGALGLVALSRPLVLVVGGEELEGAVEVLTLLAPACAALFANLYMGYLHVAAQRAGRYLIFNLVGLAVSVALGLGFTLDGGADAAARVTWITEGVVVLLAAGSFFWRNADGRRALVYLILSLGLVVACSELADSRAVPPVAAAVGGAALSVAASARRLRRWLSYARAGLDSTRS